jgi:hypothetical protein
MADYYEANPELKNQKGSGWKPYNRLKWFHEQRMMNGELPPVGARWQAWERKRELERRAGVNPRATWFALGPANFAGRMLAVATDPTNPSIVYAGAAGGGLWKSTDTGATWVPKSDELLSLAVGGVAVSPVDPNIVVIGTGEATNNIDRIGGVGILRSTDAGDTWEETDLTLLPSSGHGFHVVEVSPNGIFLAGASDGLWRSSDAGATWTLIRDGGDHYDVKWKPGDPNTVFTAKGDDSGGNNVKISTDAGLTWTKAGSGQPLSFQVGQTKIAMSAAAPDWIYAMYVDKANSTLLGIYRSTDGGSTWTLRTTTPNIPGQQGWYNLSLAVDPNDANRVIAGGVELWRSTNGATTFFGIGGNVHVDWVATDGGMWRSTNDGSSWTNQNNGLVTYQFYDICVNNGPGPYYIMGGTQDNGTDKWSGTTTWANGLGGDGMVCNINPVTGTTVYAERQFGAHRKNLNSGSGGAGSWNTIMNGISGTGAWATPVDEDQNLGNHLYTSTNQGIFRTTAGGNPWVQVANHTATWISISPVNGNVVWTVAGTAKFTTDDGGTWHDAAPYGFPTGGATKILAHPTDVNTAFVTFSGYGDGAAHVAMTTDMGASWANVTGNFPSQPVNTIVVNPSLITQWFIGTDVGVWVSVTGGETWFPYETGLPNTVVVDLEIKNSLQKLVAGTHGRGAWEIDIAPDIGTSAELTAVTGPINLMLDRPAPNPVQDRTMLRYAAKHAGAVTLTIYDVQGRLVSNLAEYSTGDGIIRTTPWFTDDVPSGVYFAVLRAGSDQKSHKLIVRK